jgi:hypothetical protein
MSGEKMTAEKKMTE